VRSIIQRSLPVKAARMCATFGSKVRFAWRSLS
jgi:hypothetical protein